MDAWKEKQKICTTLNALSFKKYRKSNRMIADLRLLYVHTHQKDI